jgi:hypothetical protein
MNLHQIGQNLLIWYIFENKESFVQLFFKGVASSGHKSSAAASSEIFLFSKYSSQNFVLEQNTLDTPFL